MIVQIPVGGYDKNFAYLIHGSGGRSFIVDPSNVELIGTYLDKYGLEPSGILLTHSHFDHTEGVEELVQKFSVPVYIHKNGVGRVKSSGDIIGLNDSEKLEIDGIPIEVIHTPGHIDDAVCFYVEAEKSLITGDTVFVGGCGRADFENSNVKDLYKSIQKIKQLPDDTLIFPGHDYGDSQVSTIKLDKEKNRYFLARDFEEFYGYRMG